jgi:hypothetical protein
MSSLTPSGGGLPTSSSGSGGAGGSAAFFPGSPASAAVAPPMPLPTVLDKPISRGTTQVSLSAFSYLFSELVQYCQNRADAVADLEKRLSDLGYGIGLRSLELLTYRTSIQAYLLTNTQPGSSSSSSSSSNSANLTQVPISLHNIAQLQGRKEKSLVAMLQFLHGQMWKSLFGRVADGLEKATDKEDEYYIYDISPLPNKFISPPKEFAHFNCATFVAGIVNGVLDGAGFQCEVGAHFNTTSSGGVRTVYVIKFDKEVTKREG